VDHDLCLDLGEQFLGGGDGRGGRRRGAFPGAEDRVGDGVGAELGEGACLAVGAAAGAGEGVGALVHPGGRLGGQECGEGAHAVAFGLQPDPAVLAGRSSAAGDGVGVEALAQVAGDGAELARGAKAALAGAGAGVGLEGVGLGGMLGEGGGLVEEGAGVGLGDVSGGEGLVHGRVGVDQRGGEVQRPGGGVLGGSLQGGELGDGDGVGDVPAEARGLAVAAFEGLLGDLGGEPVDQDGAEGGAAGVEVGQDRPFTWTFEDMF
jgi:hypothetical protein